jgi:cyanophycin synthetase
MMASMPDLDIREILILRGPNIWANYPVLEAWVDLGALNDASSEDIPGFNDRLKSWLPGMIEHRCSEGERGGFFNRLDRGTYPAHILEHVTLELQTSVGHTVGYGKARHTCVDGLYKVAVRYFDEKVAEAALRTARELLLAAYAGQDFDVATAIEALRDVVDSNALGPSTQAMVDAARARTIPWRRLQEGRSLIQLGHGTNQRRIWTAETDRSGAIAEYIAQDKDLTRLTLRRAGVPVPIGRIASDVDDAWEAAQEIGLPVVVKPRDGNHGRGVFLDMKTEEDVRAAFPVAAENGDGVIVERFVPGVDHRLLVVGGKLVAATRGEPAMVVGNGKQTIQDLVENQINSDPRRSEHDSAAWAKIDLVQWDPTVLADLQQQGHSPESVPRDGERVLVSRFANPAVDITDIVHDSVREHVSTAALAVGLDITGIDLVCIDISRPLEEQGGCVVEVNASPALQGHLQPAVGNPRPVGEAIIDMLFPDPSQARIPVVGISGTRGKTTAAKLIAHLLEATGKRLGVAVTRAMQFGTRVIRAPQGDHIGGTHGVLLHPWTELAVCEVSTESILREGLGFDRCQVGVVTNVGRDKLGICYIDTLEQMAKVHRCVVDVVLPTGTAVLNADDPLVAEMAEHCKGSVIFYSHSETSPVVKLHREQGGRALFVEGVDIMLAEGASQRALCSITEIATPVEGHCVSRIDSVLAAIGAAWALGVSDEDMAERLRCIGPRGTDIAA